MERLLADAKAAVHPVAGGGDPGQPASTRPATVGIRLLLVVHCDVLEFLTFESGPIQGDGPAFAIG